MTIRDSDLRGLVARYVRRVSDAVESSGTRRYFIPAGTRIEIDLNVLGARLLRLLADEVHKQRPRVSREKRR